MPKVTIAIPVSRDTYLPRLFTALELMECDAELTNLFVYVDAPNEVYLQARNATTASKFKHRLCVNRADKTPVNRLSLSFRRRRIAAVLNEMKQYIDDCDYILGIEDDTIVPANTLTRLLHDYAQYPYAGFIEGVELGRWGIPYIGAWTADDVYEPSRISSIMGAEGIREIDAGGLYCYMTKRDHFINHTFKTFGNDELGPDVDFGLSLRQAGHKNYLDFSIRCEHRTKDKAITLANTEPAKVELTREQNTLRNGQTINHWKQKIER